MSAKGWRSDREGTALHGVFGLTSLDGLAPWSGTDWDVPPLARAGVLSLGGISGASAW